MVDTKNPPEDESKEPPKEEAGFEAMDNLLPPSPPPIQFGQKPFFKPQTGIAILKQVLNKLVKGKFYTLLKTFQFDKVILESPQLIATTFLSHSKQNPYFNEMYAYFLKYIIEKASEVPTFLNEIEEMLYQGNIDLISQIKDICCVEEEKSRSILSVFKFTCELHILDKFSEGKIILLLNIIKELKYKTLRISLLVIGVLILGGNYDKSEMIKDFYKNFEWGLLICDLPELEALDEAIKKMIDSKYIKSRQNRKLIIDSYSKIFHHKRGEDSVWFDQD